jgi:hypothetical protein
MDLLILLALRFPIELREMIFNEMVGDGTGHLKTWETACQIRLDLMGERGRLKPDIDRETFSRTCELLLSSILNCDTHSPTGNLCEH